MRKRKTRRPIKNKRKTKLILIGSLMIFITLYLLLHTIALNNINKKRDILLLFILFIMALHGMIDDLGLDLYYNSFWFAIGNNILFKNKTYNKVL